MEITIKDLENMLHIEVSKMWSKGLIQLHTDSRLMYDPMSNSLTKLGEHLRNSTMESYAERTEMDTKARISLLEGGGSQIQKVTQY